MEHYVEPPRNTTQDIEQNNFYAESRYDTFVPGRSRHDDHVLMQRGTLWAACGWFVKAWAVPARLIAALRSYGCWAFLMSCNQLSLRVSLRVLPIRGKLNAVVPLVGNNK